MSEKFTSSEAIFKAVQTNVPDIDTLLTHTCTSMSDRPALKSHNREFGTPAKATTKPSSRKKPSSISKENKVTTMQEKGVQGKRGATNGGVPTAHVFPNSSTSDPALGPSYWAEPTPSEHRRTPTGQLTRLDTLSTGLESSFITESPDYDVTGSQVGDSVFGTGLSTITGRPSELEYHELLHDPEQTMDQTRFHRSRDMFAGVDREAVLGDREVSDITRNTNTSSHLTKHSRNTTPAFTDTSASMPSYIGPYGHAVNPAHDIPRYPRSNPALLSYDRPQNHMPFQAASFTGGNFMGGGYPTVPLLPPPGPYGHGYADEISHWQLKHHEQLRMQQLEATQPLYNTSVGASVSSVLTRDPHKLDSVKRAADNIIREKDTIIDRQKLKIMEMERHSTRSEADIQNIFLKRVQEQGDALSMKLQAKPLPSEESNYETAALKAEIAQLLSTERTDLNDIEKKLGAREYELSELKQSMGKQLQTKIREIEELQAKMKDKDELISEWKIKHTSLCMDKDEVERKNRQLERYMQDLPTLDEQAHKNSELRTLKEDKHRYKTKANKYEAKLLELQKGLESRDSLIQSLEETQDDLKVRIETLQDENKKLSGEVKRLRDGGATIPEEDLEELRYDNRRLQSDLEKARKLLEGKHKKMQQAEAHHQQHLAQAQDRLSQEENTVTGLKEEMTNKEHHFNKLRGNLKLLSAENQDLLDSKFVLQDKIKEYEKQHTGEVQKLEKRLMKELSSTFRELQAMIQICVQYGDGEDPNISSLLGIKASSTHMAELDEDEPVGDNIQALKYKLSKVKQLQGEVDKLRELMSNKYAEEWGENLNCTTQ